MTAKDYMGERGVSVRNARFVGDYVATRESVEEIISTCGFRAETWRPPKGARPYLLWTKCISTEPETDVWTLQGKSVWMYSDLEFPRLRDFTGNYATEAQALAAVASKAKEEADKRETWRAQ